MNIIILEVFVVFVLFIANGLFSMSEMALVSARKSRLRQLAETGRPGAAAALRLIDSPDHFLPTVQIGITLIGLLAGAFSGATLAAELTTVLERLPWIAAYAEAASVGMVVVALTFLSVIIGELAPKRIALAAPETIACRLSRPIESLSGLVRPVVHIFSTATDLLLRLMRIKPGKPDNISKDELRLLLREGCERGVFHKNEPRMVEAVLSFNQRPIHEIMTPRAKLVCIALDETRESLREKIIGHGHSSYPVLAADGADIAGVVTVKSIYASLAGGESSSVGDLISSPLFVAPDEPLLAVLERFKRSGVHLAVVREACGPAIGLVTLVDVLEAIVGDIPSLDERQRPELLHRQDGSLLVDGQYDLGKLAVVLNAALDLTTFEDGTTVATFVSDRLAGHPREGDSFLCAGLCFEILDMDRTSVDKVLIRREPVNHESKAVDAAASA